MLWEDRVDSQHTRPCRACPQETTRNVWVAPVRGKASLFKYLSQLPHEEFQLFRSQHPTSKSGITIPDIFTGIAPPITSAGISKDNSP